MRSSTFYALAAASATAVQAVSQGFNYGSTNPDGSIRTQATFQSEFTAAQNLAGTSGFTSARLYTMIQGGTANTPISAIPAAIATKTTLLLGLWGSGGSAGFNNEIAALKAAITQYGTAFTSLVVGISVGSEDLYRDSSTGQAAMAGVGVGPDVIVSYITQLRSALAGTALSGVSVGHVDTWTAWVNGTNSAVINAVDWLGYDAYPYFQSTQANGIQNGAGLFNEALAATHAVAGGKPVWITETGWPVSGPVSGAATASTANAKTYWDQVGCPNFGKTNIFWYTLLDAGSSPSFGIIGDASNPTPLFDLSCSAVSSSSSAASTASSAAGRVSSATSASVTNTQAILASAQSVASQQTAVQAPSQAGNGVGASSVRAPAASAAVIAGSGSNGSGVAITTATGGVPTTVAVKTSAVASSAGSGSGSGSGAGAGAGAGASTTTSATRANFTGAANANVAGSLLGAGVLAVAAMAL